MLSPSRLFYLLIILTGLCFSSASSQADPKNYQLELISRAQGLKLAEDPQWRALLHFRGAATASTIQQATFFLDPAGRRNPSAELGATLAGFFDPTKRSPWDEPVQCIFPARYAWLDSRLHFDTAKMPQTVCSRFDEWMAALKPQSVSLIFPSAFINNPASTFGHTLLRLDQARDRERRPLLEYAANYAAQTDADNALLYAFRGIFGGYNGYFSVAAYYEKVKQYNDMENRDIWEYELNFSPEETALLARHLWELRGVPFPYYYFDDNCAFQLLSLLEVARPSLQLQARFPTWVIPVDTVREISAAPGLVSRVIFRPSAATKLHHRIQQSVVDVQEMALRLAEGQTAQFPGATPSPQLEAQAHDLAYEYLSYQLQKDASQARELQARALSLITQRSKLSIGDSVPPPSTPAKRPEEGHRSARVSLGVSQLRDRAHTLVEFRPSYHALLDPEAGHLPGAEIISLQGIFGLSPNERVHLERFTLLGLTSLSPRNRFMRPTSWYFDASTSRSRLGARDTTYRTQAEGGLGHSYGISKSSLCYALLGTTLRYSHEYDSNYALGAGPRLGALLFLSDQLAAHVRGTHTTFAAAGLHHESTLQSGIRYTLSRDTALELDFTQQWQNDRNDQEITARVAKFF